MDDDTDWILMDFSAPELPEKTDKKHSATTANKPLGRTKKTGAKNKSGAGATKTSRKASAKFKSKKV